MSTRSTIALEFADGTVHQVYCHFDGYLSGIGNELASDYTDPFKLRELIAGGDMSSIGSPYTDRGEELNVNKYKSFTEYMRDGQQEEYDYILRDVNGVATWFVRFYASEGEWVTLADARLKEQEHA